MKRKNRFVVNPFLLGIALATWAVLTLGAVAAIPMGRYSATLVFFILGLLFLVVTVRNAVVVCVTPEGLERRLLGKHISMLPWKDVREVGVCGIRPFHKKGSDNVGTMYIYISGEHMTDDERFDMILNWPPRDKIYLLHSVERLEAVQLQWAGTITMYNSGTFHIG